MKVVYEVMKKDVIVKTYLRYSDAISHVLGVLGLKEVKCREVAPMQEYFTIIETTNDTCHTNLGFFVQ